MRTVIIDVRTPKEFADASIPGALNIPSTTYTPEDFAPFKSDHICLVCETGNRATKVKANLEEHGFQHISLLNKQMAQLNERKKKNGWTIDRQFRLALAILLGIFFGGISLGFTAFWIIPIIIVSGLLYSAITDNCYLKLLIAQFPWNKEPQQEAAPENLSEEKLNLEVC